MRVTLLVLLAVLIGLAAVGSTLATIDAVHRPEAVERTAATAVDCVANPDCAGAAATGLLTVALLAAAAVLVQPPARPATRAARVHAAPPGRLLEGGLFRPPRRGS